MSKELKKVFRKMEEGKEITFLDVLTALSAVTNLVTLDHRPADPRVPKTACELNGHCCCCD